MKEINLVDKMVILGQYYTISSNIVCKKHTISCQHTFLIPAMLVYGINKDLYGTRV